MGLKAMNERISLPQEVQGWEKRKARLAAVTSEAEGSSRNPYLTVLSF